MKGRKPKLTVVEGNVMPNHCPGPTAWLSDSAKAEWRRVAPLLHERKLLAPDTMATLESYCVAVGIVRDCSQPEVVESSLFGSQTVGQSPARMKTMFAAMREARLLAAELGLTPHRRGAKAQEEGKKDGEWDADLLA